MDFCNHDATIILHFIHHIKGMAHSYSLAGLSYALAIYVTVSFKSSLNSSKSSNDITSSKTKLIILFIAVERLISIVTPSDFLSCFIRFSSSQNLLEAVFSLCKSIMYSFIKGSIQDSCQSGIFFRNIFQSCSVICIFLGLLSKC